MRRRRAIGIACALAAATSVLALDTADAQRWRRGPPPGYHYDDRDDDGYYRRGEGYYRRGRGGGGPPRGYRDRGRRCRDEGTGGTIIGAIAGGLLGNSVAGHGDRTTGTILGGGLGALAGRAIDRDCRR